MYSIYIYIERERERREERVRLIEREGISIKRKLLKFVKDIFVLLFMTSSKYIFQGESPRNTVDNPEFSSKRMTYTSVDGPNLL